MPEMESKVEGLARAIREAHCDVSVKGDHCPRTDSAYAPLALAALDYLEKLAEERAQAYESHHPDATVAVGWIEFGDKIRSLKPTP